MRGVHEAKTHPQPPGQPGRGVFVPFTREFGCEISVLEYTCSKIPSWPGYGLYISLYGHFAEVSAIYMSPRWGSNIFRKDYLL
jgi:hypothetical protein